MKPSLVILAAGIGSRYGGIKQLDGFGPDEEKIIDYTVYDAIKAGYGKIIFVIRKAIEEDFKKAILDHWIDKADIRIVFQELDSLPKGYEVPEGREKPWGTAHAVWMSEDEVNEPFAIVNADDFYGRNSLATAKSELEKMNPDQHAACLVGYRLKNTLSSSGSVSRGVCEADKNGFLTGITERTKIQKEGDLIFFEENGEKTELAEETLVSMNLMGFSPKVFEEIRNGFDPVYKKGHENVKVEYGIPTVLNSLIHKGVKVPVIPTRDQWFGVTYSEDKSWVRDQLNKLHNEGVYPDNLWI